MAQQLKLSVECVLDVRNTVGESPVWSARESALYWVDILEATIHRWEPASGAHRTWTLPAVVGSLGLRRRGGLVLAMRTGFHLFDLTSGALTFVHHPEPDIATNRLNDGKVSPDGRFWAGTMDDRPVKEETGRLYRLDPDGSCRCMGEGLIVSNGLERSSTVPAVGRSRPASTALAASATTIARSSSRASISRAGASC